jgi:membrane protein required for beta-lactamase induction
MVHSSDELSTEEWRQAVNKQMRAMAEQLGELKAALAVTKATLRSETTDHVECLRDELRVADRRRLRWVSLGIFCQIVASVLALFADS